VKRAGTKKDIEAKEKHSDRDTRKAWARAADSSMPEKLKKDFEIDIFRGWCKSCGICAAFCPRECIGTDEEGSPVVQDATRCSGCGWCEVHCPDFAISVRPRSIKAVQPEED
jgi:2-oxoglutarate ferredoxin oxidoreductase subunit delta